MTDIDQEWSAEALVLVGLIGGTVLMTDTPGAGPSTPISQVDPRWVTAEESDQLGGTIGVVGHWHRCGEHT